MSERVLRIFFLLFFCFQITILTNQMWQLGKKTSINCDLTQCLVLQLAFQEKGATVPSINKITFMNQRQK